MTINEQIKSLENLKAILNITHHEAIDAAIGTLQIFKTTHFSSKSEAVLVTMSNKDYKLFHEFKAFRQFADNNNKQDESETTTV